MWSKCDLHVIKMWFTCDLHVIKMWWYCVSRLVLVLLALAEQMEEIADSLCVGQQYQGDERVVLFLKMAAGYRYCRRITWPYVVVMWPWYSLPPVSFSNELVKKVKSEIRSQLSARHVPSIVLETKDIPVSVFYVACHRLAYSGIHLLQTYLFLSPPFSPPLPLFLYSHFPSLLSFLFFSQYTINSKKVEVAVKRIISGEDIQQRGALANPQSLNLYYNIPELDIRIAGQ